MNIEVLVSAMKLENSGIYLQMNLQSDAVIINQYDSVREVSENINGKNVRFITCSERGVGRSRNRAIMSSTADICVFADDDMLFADGYEEVILSEFEKNSKADAILFNIDVKNSKVPVQTISKSRKMTLRDAMRYGIPALAVKREKLYKANIAFSLLFGGGARYGSGEDTIFFRDMLAKKMNVYICDRKIAETDSADSSWFKGFDNNFFKDKGALYAQMFGRKARLTAIVTSYRWRKKLGGEYSFKRIFKNMNEGISEFLE